jgi:hypothetical protein
LTSNELHGVKSQKIELYINSICNKIELPQQGREFIIVPSHKKSAKTECSNFLGISLLSTSYIMLCNILLSRLTPYVEEVIEDHQCLFQHKRYTTDQFSVRYWRKRKSRYNEAVRQLFIDFKEACDSVRREVLYNISN